MSRIALAALLVTSVADARKVQTADDVYDVTDPVAVRASLDGRTARMFVDYRITSEGGSTAQFDMPLPFGGVVVAATITHAGASHRMMLDASKTVDDQFAAAIRSSHGHATPTIWVAKVSTDTYGARGYGVLLAIGAPITTELLVTLEVTAPTCFFRDTRYVRMPDGWQRAVRAAKPSEDVVAACTDVLEGPDHTNTWKSFAAPEAARMPSGERLFTSTARLAVDSGLHLARTELALATNIADIPRDLATVILVDESRSMNDRQRKAQREIVLGYLRAAPNSRVQIIAFSRRTHALLPGWMVASRALSRLERELASMTPRNGSNFDLGLADAGRLLSAIKGTRRVLLVTDEALASRLAAQPENLANLVPAGTIINVAVPGADGNVDEKGDEVLTRHDSARLARLAAATTGFSTSLGELDLQSRIAVDASMLVRPISLDHIRTTGLGWSDLEDTERQTLSDHSCHGSLEAGDSCVWWTRGTKFASTIQLEGLLWNRRVVRLVRPLGDPGHTIAREIVGTGTAIIDDRPDVDGDGVTETSRRIDALARAVTNTTSLFVRWGGTVPLVEGGMFGFGRSSFGRGGSGGIGHIGRVTSIHAPVDLASQLRPLVASCGLGTARAEVTMELTFQEIVDVDVKIEPAGAHAATVRTCIEDAVWDFAPSLPSLQALRTITVVF